MKEYICLKDLEVYKLARKLSDIAWPIYDNMEWGDKKTMGDQFIESIDSVGSNIAEGYGRYHYLDRIKFYYNSRASLNESCEHWLELIYERKKISKELFDRIKNIAKNLSVKLNNFIASTYKAKYNKENT